MKIERLDTFIGVALIAILGYYGAQMAANTQVISANTDRGEQMVFLSAGGVDLSGKLISPSSMPTSNRTLVFLLHGQSLQKDLEFWAQVEALLPKNSVVQLVGDCDGDLCTDALKQATHPPEFPVIEYGEITSSEALLDVDAAGNSILLNGKNPQRFIQWRAASVTPTSFVQEAMK